MSRFAGGALPSCVGTRPKVKNGTTSTANRLAAKTSNGSQIQRGRLVEVSLPCLVIASATPSALAVNSLHRGRNKSKIEVVTQLVGLVHLHGEALHCVQPIQSSNEAVRATARSRIQP